MKQVTSRNFKGHNEIIEQIAELLVVEIDVPFQIQFFNHKNIYKGTWYKLTYDGLMYSYDKDGRYNNSKALQGLLLGKHQVIKEDE